jgi:hypothetical protein
MGIRLRLGNALGIVVLGAAIGALCGGCADLSMPTMFTPSSGTGTAAAPKVQDCSLIKSTSPTQYVCGSKVYSTFELAKIRQDEEKKYVSGQ